MLSRLYSRATFRQNPLQLFGLSYRSAVTAAAAPPVEAKKTEDELVPAVIFEKDAVPLPSPYDSPQRDYVNFPDPVRRYDPAPTRILIFPEEWFTFLHKKLGVSGPYTLGIGVITFLVSKEFYLFDHDFTHTVAFYFWVYVFCKTPLGKLLPDFDAKEWQEGAEELRQFKQTTIDNKVDAIEHEKKEQWRQEGQKILFQAKRENVGLQLEAAYRQNSIDFYRQVKRRLDYQVEVAKIDSRIKQRYMVDWVIKKVNEAITPDQEKEALKRCISDLDALAAKA